MKRVLEQCWPIQERLKNENSDELFSWIGERIAQVIQEGCKAFDLAPDQELPMGVTFSFPMEQSSLSKARLMAMGKGFAITSDLDLGGHLIKGYERHRGTSNPRVRVAAISNDAVATLVSFMFQLGTRPHQKAAMALIVGTGTNATIPLRLSSLHPSKRPQSIGVLPGQGDHNVKVTVNTEWSINGSAPPIRKLNLITAWDEILDAAGEAPGFQPFEYMTAGRYLGELARIVLVDYMTSEPSRASHNQVPPRGLLTQFGLSTTFISHFYPGSPRGPMLDQLKAEFPVGDAPDSFQWTQGEADALYHIARAIQVRAAGIVAAATVGLLSCAGELPSASDHGTTPSGEPVATELAVGYTGGCIQHFQNYLVDCQRFIDKIIDLEFGGKSSVSVRLYPCHDGGITGAGILVPAALASQNS